MVEPDPLRERLISKLRTHLLDACAEMALSRGTGA
jgi:hypothetical protein